MILHLRYCPVIQKMESQCTVMRKLQTLFPNRALGRSQNDKNRTLFTVGLEDQMENLGFKCRNNQRPGMFYKCCFLGIWRRKTHNFASQLKAQAGYYVFSAAVCSAWLCHVSVSVLSASLGSVVSRSFADPLCNTMPGAHCCRWLSLQKTPRRRRHLENVSDINITSAW